MWCCEGRACGRSVFGTAWADRAQRAEHFAGLARFAAYGARARAGTGDARGVEARGISFDHAYSSPLGRARCTAELIVGEGRSIELVDDLREWHLGSLEGTSNREMPAQPWGDYPVAFGGESESELRARMVAALSRIMARPQHNCVLAVSHGSACQEFLEYVAGGGGQPDNGAVLHFGYCDGAFSLLDW